ncbi:hypothetical protein AC056_06130 [Acinetobacter genomosp. 33YU]|nr:hypothetical protein AC056_06130 [Acinetobacter genomosp. 33YU]
MIIKSVGKEIYIDIKNVLLKVGFLLIFPVLFIFYQTPHYLSFFEYLPIFFKKMNYIGYLQILILLWLIYYACKEDIVITKF